MTMHLMSHAYTNNRNRKVKPKYTKANLEKWAADLIRENKKRKQLGQPRISLDDYINLLHGILPQKSVKFEPYIAQKNANYRETPNYPSFSSNKVNVHACSKTETLKYTGTLVKGIATMHKSNAVPIIDEQQARDIATMRRN